MNAPRIRRRQYLTALALLVSLAGCDLSALGRQASQGQLALDSLVVTDVIAEATLAPSVLPGQVVLNDIDVLYRPGTRVRGDGSVQRVPDPGSTLVAAQNFYEPPSELMGRRVVALLAYTPTDPDRRWNMWYGLHAEDLSPLPGEAWDFGNMQLQRLFSAAGPTRDARLVALMEYVGEQVAFAAARNAGIQAPSETPWSELLRDPLPDPADAWRALPPEIRSLAAADVPPQVDLRFVDVRVILEVASEADVPAVGLLASSGVSRIQVVPNSAPVAIVTRTVSGENWRVVAYDTAGAPIQELGTIDAETVVAPDAIRIVIDDAGQVRTERLTLAQFEELAGTGAVPAEPASASGN